MTSREQFESKFPVPEGVAWKDSIGMYEVVDIWKLDQAITIGKYNWLWEGWQAARPQWQPMDTCPKHVDVLFYREDCGVINGQFTCADSFMTDRERESGEYSEEEQFNEDAWCYGPQGVERLDGDLVPTHWMPYPDEPKVKP